MKEDRTQIMEEKKSLSGNSVRHSGKSKYSDGRIEPNRNVETWINTDDLENNERRDSKFSTRQNPSRKESIASSKDVDLDYVLVNEIGQFGRFQRFHVLLFCVPLIMAAFPNEYIFSAAALPHRCRVPECGETTKDHMFEPPWLPGAIPPSGSGFESCERFEPIYTNRTLDTCPATLFTDTTIGCDGFVYGANNSVVYDFDLGCQEWLRALAGTLNGLGTLLVLPITGYVSDRYGRRVAFVISIFNLGLFGLIRAFSVNYPMYLVLHLLQTTLGSGIFSACYVLAAEMVGPKYRILTSAMSTGMYTVGKMVVGMMAWLVEPWRTLIMVLHIPCFIIISYYWIIDESFRWLLSNKKFSEAKLILEKVARVNKKQITEKSMEALMNPPSFDQDVTNEDSPGLVVSIFNSPVLLRRVCTTPIWWITCIFVYYGLSINATGLSDTSHLNYILVGAVELPGFVVAVLVVNRIGRKPTLSIGFFISGACNFAFAFIPNDMSALRLVVYLLSTFSISVALPALYLFTSELYPTQFRHSLLAFSSMVGRLGVVIAPLTPVLMVYWEGIPSVMFGSMALLSGVLVFTQPETLGTKLPDTLEEAEAIGRPESKINRNKT